MRYRALQELGFKEIPENWVKRAEELTAEEKRRFIIVDNVGFGEWDWDELANNWDIEELEEWGLDVPNFEDEVLEAKEDDFSVPDGGIDTDIVLGDLFEIGDHRLLCGDSTDSDAVDRLMEGQKADIVFTSPPYNLGENVSLSTRGETDNAYATYQDKKTQQDYNDLLFGFTNSFFVYCEYLIVNIQSLAGNKKSVIDYQFEYKENISDIAVWIKSNPQPAMAKNVMNSAFEYFIFISTGDNVTRAINTGDFRGTFSNVFNGTTNNENKVKEHKAAFSATMCGEFIKTFSKNSVIDCFLGTGTTMVAAHQLNRKCYGMELDPKYCQVIINRMLNLDPDLVVLKNGQPYVNYVKNT
jgi:DNA modification methylase